jgi:putative alpha-1,2-mannosidase
MVGTMGDVVFADAIVNNIPGFDVQTAYEAIRKDAFVKPDSSSQGAGRECMDAYLKYGYIPRNAPDDSGGICSEVVSRTLDYLQADYAIAQAANTLGYTSDATELLIRSANYTKMFNSDYGMLRSREIITEKWTEPFDQYAWGGDYTEGMYF